MNPINPEILLSITIVLLIGVTFRGIYLRKKVSYQTVLLADVHNQLNDAAITIENLQQIEKKYNTFSNDLKQAEIASKVQNKPRVLNQSSSDIRPPERYKYVHSMARQGITAGEIASILAISPHEADQLVALANLSNK